MRDSDRSRCWGDTSCQPRGCADLIKARSLASVDPRQYHTKLARADSATTRGHMWATMMRSSTLVTPGATTSRVRLPARGRARLRGKNSLVIGEEVFDCTQLKRSASA